MKPAEQRSSFYRSLRWVFLRQLHRYLCCLAPKDITHWHMWHATFKYQLYRHWLINRRSPPVSSIEKLSISPSVRSLCFKFLGLTRQPSGFCISISESQHFSGYFQDIFYFFPSCNRGNRVAIFDFLRVGTAKCDYPDASDVQSGTHFTTSQVPRHNITAWSRTTEEGQYEQSPCTFWLPAANLWWTNYMIFGLGSKKRKTKGGPQAEYWQWLWEGTHGLNKNIFTCQTWHTGSHGNAHFATRSSTLIPTCPTWHAKPAHWNAESFWRVASGLTKNTVKAPTVRPQTTKTKVNNAERWWRIVKDFWQERYRPRTIPRCGCSISISTSQPWQMVATQKLRWRPRH